MLDENNRSLSLDEYKEHFKYVYEQANHLMKDMHIKNNPDYGVFQITENVYKNNNVLDIRYETVLYSRRELKDIFDYEIEFDDIRLMMEDFVYAIVKSKPEIFKNSTRTKLTVNAAKSNNNIYLKYETSVIIIQKPKKLSPKNDSE
jgi:hypothetical protein